MTPLQERIRSTIHTLESKIDECHYLIQKIKNFCKHESCYVDMAKKHNTFLPLRFCVACSSEVGEPTEEESVDCLTMYDNVIRKRKYIA